MIWEDVFPAFQDELEKISVSLAGLRPETILSYPQPQPMVTPGAEKAQRILALAEEKQPVKTAGFAGGPDTIPGFGSVFRKKRDEDPPPDAVDKAKRVGGYLLAGAGTGKFVTDIATGFDASPKQRAIGTAVGAALGGAELVRQHVKKKRWEKKNAK
jgi:dihydropteroate synthase